MVTHVITYTFITIKNTYQKFNIIFYQTMTKWLFKHRLYTPRIIYIYIYIVKLWLSELSIIQIVFNVSERLTIANVSCLAQLLKCLWDLCRKAQKSISSKNIACNVILINSILNNYNRCMFFMISMNILLRYLTHLFTKNDFIKIKRVINLLLI